MIEKVAQKEPKWSQNGGQNLTFGDKNRFRTRYNFSMPRLMDLGLKMDPLDLKNHQKTSGFPSISWTSHFLLRAVFKSKNHQKMLPKRSQIGAQNLKKVIQNRIWKRASKKSRKWPPKAPKMDPKWSQSAPHSPLKSIKSQARAPKSPQTSKKSQKWCPEAPKMSPNR